MEPNVSSIPTHRAIDQAAEPLRTLAAQAKTKADYAAIIAVADELYVAAGVKQ